MFYLCTDISVKHSRLIEMWTKQYIIIIIIIIIIITIITILPGSQPRLNVDMLISHELCVSMGHYLEFVLCCHNVSWVKVNHNKSLLVTELFLV